MARPKDAPSERANTSTPVAVPISLCSTEFCTASTIPWTIMPTRVARMNIYAEEGGERRHANQREGEDRRRGPPVLVAAPNGDEDQRAGCAHHQCRAPVVDPVLDALEREGEHRRRDDEGHDADRDIDVEDPAPR